MDGAITYYENYSPVGDVLVLAICFVFIILIRSAFISKTKNFAIFRIILGLLILAAGLGLFYHVLMNATDTVSHTLIYALRIGYHAALFGNLFLYVVYATIPLRLDSASAKRFIAVAAIGYIGVMLYDTAGSMFKFGFYISEEGRIHEGVNIFPVGYVFL
ncbi:MAG: hypothetical protein IJ661_13230 [Lachnospiraceae bacterium]|nr:hypothetical protein [Lachnospiraceae bacterium]